MNESRLYEIDAEEVAIPAGGGRMVRGTFEPPFAARAGWWSSPTAAGAAG